MAKFRHPGRQTGEHRKHGDWCCDSPLFLFFFTREKSGYRDKRIPKMVRCPKCNRRLKPHVYDCEDHNRYSKSAFNKVDKGSGHCCHVFVPAHKTK